jgi:hypothetical protein
LTTFEGTYFTIQALRMYHAEVMPQIEIVVVDNNHASAYGKAVRDFLNWVKGDVATVYYHALTGVTGTAAPRQKVFEIGTAPVVMCIDPHIFLVPGSLKKLIEFFDNNPETRDLYQGPMVYDDLKNFSTHFKDVWGTDQMWGEWGTDMRADDPNAEPFEIPAMGLGVFACRREAWLGFNPRFRGFGGEEWYIHEKYRQAGHKTMCLPFLRWIHRFGRPGGHHYPLDLWDKARNYVIGLTELGVSLDRARAAFVDTGKIPAEHWANLVATPDTYRPMAPGCVKYPPPRTLDEIFTYVKSIPRDLDQHAEAIRGLAMQSPRITAFVKRHEWNAILAAARPTNLIVYQKEEDPLLQEIHNAVQAEQAAMPRHYTTTTGPGADSLIAEIEETDLLILDTIHSASRLTAELDRHASKVRQRILVRSTGAFGESAEGSGEPGLYYAMKPFLEKNPQWFIMAHSSQQWGWTMLSCNPPDRPSYQIHLWLLGHGPGTELKNLLASLGVNPGPSCDCNARAITMDQWGVEKCKENRNAIVGWLREGQERWGWKDKFAAAAQAVKTGLAFKLNPFDPFPGIVDEAIRMAEKAEKEKKPQEK